MSLLDEFMDEPAKAPVLPKKDAYDALPESIRMYMTRTEWMWLSDQEKHALVAEECEPPAVMD